MEGCRNSKDYMMDVAGRVFVLGVGIDNVNLGEALKRIQEYVENGTAGLVVTANPEIVMLARKSPDFKAYLDNALMVTADGIGILIGARLLGRPIKQRVTGIDLTTALFEQAAAKKYKFYFVGAKPGVAEAAAENIRKAYPGIEIIGIQHGYFNDDSKIIDDIKIKKPDILLAALGMGKQEKWIEERVKPAGVPVSIGVGGSFDVFSGEAKRAPKWIQDAGIEWLYRLIRQPSRFWRMLQLPKFLGAIILSRLFSGK
ncbi:WecB/TagA/CpsF family glycosyltransferase [Phosphitispora sp. TUW77]|uniref:WecB/TagA/CpsF family glycosyltransferase n=1 Tax=Phosphitispora sp. TUW77 TaxID=3152361 RepID=UPI003AB3FBF9